MDGLIAEKKFYLSSIEYLNNQREIIYCFGYLSVYGILTARSCCDVDELLVIDQEKSEEYPIEINSIWVDNYICLINKTESVNHDARQTIQTQICSISMLDRNTDDFVNIKIDNQNITCLEQKCLLSLHQNTDLILLNGTGIICNDNIYGIIVTSKFYK